MPCFWLRVQGSRAYVKGLGSRVKGVGFRVKGSGSRVEGAFRVWGWRARLGVGTGPPLSSE